ncbi:hypothetical protein SNOG_04915 [Parastagonospora nodorum SN15]|uniref:Uncharacterized protein n=1 Tax=Phaeosphaeria nodorum (strain SN15 / ATCC MYA-4574 / FGSC 10173) TaxID=321614 RepID=Q0UTJ9_PHANO|nr:hypothetical protein SNOG_04915 [Parastagonospora nodorum SN15]EAT87306.1 hypothetical protein SNOG_04915 [Parastagonospora nodorum SN15]
MPRLPFSFILIPLFSIITTAQAAPAPPSSTNATSSTSFTSNPSSPSWSKEAIFTLAGVVIAVAGVLTTLTLSSTRIRENLCQPFKYCAKRNKERSDRRLQNKYDEWLAFQEWLELSNARGGA